MTLPARTFAGLVPELETFIERAGAREAAAVLDRWSALREEGWDVEALTYDDGGQVTELVGLGYRYKPAISRCA